jgi:Zn-dependent M28 family amino/carboxypeptidase
MQVVRDLASPQYEGRRTGTRGGRAALAYIRRAFERVGLTPAGVRGFDQPFRFQQTTAVNLIGRVLGTRPDSKTLVVTAHYDHLGLRNGAIYHGADDNASGVAALLAIAQYVTARPLGHPVLFVALDAEEQGLLGATTFLDRPPVPITRIALNVNLDMVSRSDTNEVYVAGTYHYPGLKPILEGVQRRSTVRVLFGHDEPKGSHNPLEDWTFQSDHGAFHKLGVPFLYFGVEDHPDRHKPTDTVDRINSEFLRRVVETVLDALIALDQHLS